MSYQEAIAAGVRVETVGKKNMYFPTCHICGGESQSLSYVPTYKYTCDQCKAGKFLADRENRVCGNAVAKEKKYENALDRIARHSFTLKDYETAIAAVKKNLHRDKWFNSTEEIVAALELIKNGVKARHQVQIGKFHVDFLLPDEKIVLEIDGSLYHQTQKREREKLRDEIILTVLGQGWEVIRISDKLINQNPTKLVQAIRKMRDKRQVIRRTHSGIIPAWYSDTAG